MNEETEKENNSGAGKKFFKKHWNMVVYWIIAAIVAVIGTILVFLWFVGEAQSTSLVPICLLYTSPSPRDRS